MNWTNEILSWDIPRICTASADWLACMVYLAHMRHRFSGARFWLAGAAGLAVLSVYMILTDGFDGALFNLFYAGSAVLMLLLFLLLCRESFWKLVYYCARAFLCAGFASSLMWQLYIWSAFELPVMRNIPVMVLFWVLLYAATFGLVWRLEIHGQQDNGLDPGARVSLTVAFMAFVFYVISSISYAPFDTPFGGGNRMDVYNFRTLIYFSGMALLYGYHRQLWDLQEKREMDALQDLLHLQYETYKRSQESIDLVNQKYHDLKHQIALLRSQGNEGRNSVLDQMESEIQSYEALNITGNKVLDTVLTSKSLHCQSQGIQMTCVADGAALSFMSAMDISSLFGNALDNAIESVSKISSPEKRLIHVAISRKKSFLCIKIENCYEGQLRFFGGRPQTTKRNTRYHGFGLKSIEATAAKYGGSVHINAENGWFELQVMIPLTGKTGNS